MFPVQGRFFRCELRADASFLNVSFAHIQPKLQISISKQCPEYATLDFKQVTNQHCGVNRCVNPSLGLECSRQHQLFPVEAANCRDMRSSVSSRMIKKPWAAACCGLCNHRLRAAPDQPKLAGPGQAGEFSSFDSKLRRRRSPPQCIHQGWGSYGLTDREREDVSPKGNIGSDQSGAPYPPENAYISGGGVFHSPGQSGTIFGPLLT